MVLFEDYAVGHLQSHYLANVPGFGDEKGVGFVESEAEYWVLRMPLKIARLHLFGDLHIIFLRNWRLLGLICRISLHILNYPTRTFELVRSINLSLRNPIFLIITLVFEYFLRVSVQHAC